MKVTRETRSLHRRRYTSEPMAMIKLATKTGPFDLVALHEIATQQQEVIR